MLGRGRKEEANHPLGKNVLHKSGLLIDLVLVVAWQKVLNSATSCLESGRREDENCGKNTAHRFSIYRIGEGIEARPGVLSGLTWPHHGGEVLVTGSFGMKIRSLSVKILCHGGGCHQG